MPVMGAEQPFASAVGRYLRLDYFRPGEREPLGQFEVLARAAKRRRPLEVDRLDDERVAFPPAA